MNKYFNTNVNFNLKEANDFNFQSIAWLSTRPYSISVVLKFFQWCVRTHFVK